MHLYDYKDFVGSTASVCTIIQFLAGTMVCLKIVQNKTTGDISSFPFVSGCLSTSLWLRYGFILQEWSIILVNTIGVTLFFAYVVTFFIYSLKKTTVIRQFLVCTVFLALTLTYIEYELDLGEARNRLGTICSMVTIMFFAAPLTSFFHVVRVKNTESISFAMIFTNFVVSLQWFIYGFILKDNFIQVTNFLGFALSGFMLALFCVYPRTPKGYSSELISSL